MPEILMRDRERQIVQTDCQFAPRDTYGGRDTCRPSPIGCVIGLVAPPCGREPARPPCHSSPFPACVWDRSPFRGCLCFHFWTWPGPEGGCCRRVGLLLCSGSKW